MHIHNTLSKKKQLIRLQGCMRPVYFRFHITVYDKTILYLIDIKKYEDH